MNARGRSIRCLAVAIACLGAASATLGAQRDPPLIIGLDASDVQVTRDVATPQSLSGQVLGAKAALSFWRLQLEGRYAEGALSAAGLSSTPPEDLVDARVILRARIASWLSLGVGPHLRAFVAPSGTARWSRTEIHSRIEGDLITGLARLRVDAWYAVSATANVQGGGTGARGGEAGLTIRIPRTPTALNISYIADQATFTNGGTEFVDGIRVALILDRIFAPRPPVRGGTR